jgi:peptidyl-prolyl cis-trans isomerase B (cyclophilin B)
VPVAAAALLPLLAACGGGSSSSTSPDTAASSPSQSQSSSASDVSCDYAPAPQGAVGDPTPPPATPTVSGAVHVAMKTSIGEIDATLDADTAPCTVGSFVSLAGQGFFDNTPCHRLTTPPAGLYVLQCGDPTGTGTGGPGYTVPDELSGTETYPAGTLAMARTQAPDSGGSQFFIVYRDTRLSPKYTVFGTIDSAGLAAVRTMAKQGSDDAFGQGDGHPKVTVTLESVTTD